MKRTVDDAGKILGTALLLLATTAFADIKENPYEVIVVRNAFNIHPAPPPAVVVPTPPPPAAPPATVKLRGITTLGGKTRATLEITTPGKQPIKTEWMEAGDRVETVELLAIYPNDDKVKVRNGTIETNLEFEIAQSPAPAKATARGPTVLRPGMPVPNRAIPTASVQHPPTAYNQRSRSYGNRGSVTVAGAEVTAPTPIPAPAITPRTTINRGLSTINRAGAVNTVAPAVPTYRTIPPRPIRTTTTPTPSPSPPMTKEEAMINLEAQRMVSPPNAPPLPPTPLTPMLQEQ